MRKCELCGDLFPEEELRDFIRYPGRYVRNYACKKCIEEHTLGKYTCRFRVDAEDVKRFFDK